VKDIAVEPRSEDEAEEPSNADAILDITFDVEQADNTFDVEDRSLTP
jgi:hypothetical protein